MQRHSRHTQRHSEVQREPQQTQSDIHRGTPDTTDVHSRHSSHTRQDTWWRIASAQCDLIMRPTSDIAVPNIIRQLPRAFHQLQRDIHKHLVRHNIRHPALQNLLRCVATTKRGRERFGCTFNCERFCDLGVKPASELRAEALSCPNFQNVVRSVLGQDQVGTA